MASKNSLVKLKSLASVFKILHMSSPQVSAICPIVCQCLQVAAHPRVIPSLNSWTGECAVQGFNQFCTRLCPVALDTGQVFQSAHTMTHVSHVLFWGHDSSKRHVYRPMALCLHTKVAPGSTVIIIIRKDNMICSFIPSAVVCCLRVHQNHGPKLEHVQVLIQRERERDRESNNDNL